VMAWLAMGVKVIADRQPTSWPSLYRHIANLPVVNGSLPTRYALAMLPLMGVILVDAINVARQRPRATLGTPATTAVVVPWAVAVALLPLFPTPLPTTHRAPVPVFISSGAWRQCVPDGGVLVPVPLPTPTDPDPMRWAAAANDAFALPEGFFIGAYGAHGRASVGTYKQPTSGLLADVARTGVVPAITDDTRRQAQKDLAFWHADCVALAHVPQQDALRTTLEQLLGPGTPIVDTWTWKITP
jgi:hypothetical protein